MNSNQVKGTVKDTAGAVRRKAGEAMGDTTQQVKGLRDQAEGKLQKTAGDAQERAEDRLDEGRSQR